MADGGRTGAQKEWKVQWRQLEEFSKIWDALGGDSWLLKGEHMAINHTERDIQPEVKYFCLEGGGLWWNEKHRGAHVPESNGNKPPLACFL